MDSIQAIKFIKENIQHFGGDPNQITVFGQSSGAAMISALVISPTVPKDLFQGAIIQSASIFASWTHSSDLIEDARAIAKAAGVNPIKSTKSTESLNRAFKKMKVSSLLKAAKKSRVRTINFFCIIMINHSNLTVNLVFYKGNSYLNREITKDGKFISNRLAK